MVLRLRVGTAAFGSLHEHFQFRQDLDKDGIVADKQHGFVIDIYHVFAEHLAIANGGEFVQLIADKSNVGFTGCHIGLLLSAYCRCSCSHARRNDSSPGVCR